MTVQPFSRQLKEFISKADWTFAKTMPQWPHEYIVKDKDHQELFVEIVRHIRKYGYEGPFYHKRYIFFEEDGLVYWTIGAPVDETKIINRCWKTETYEARLKNGTMPKINLKMPHDLI